MRRPGLTRAFRGRHRRRIAATLALVVGVAVVVAVVLATQASTSSNAASASTQATGATTVQRRDLVETDTQSGTLSYASPRTVYNRLSGTITWLPSIGQVIKPGQALFKVDGAPVILMSGSTPAYRDLTPADSAGPDILELNRNLVELGFNPDGIVVDDEWQAATTAGVDVLQAFLGETEIGAVTLGQIVFLPGDQLVSAVDATLGSTGGGSSPGNAGSSSNASELAIPGGSQFVSLHTNSQPPRHRSGHVHGRQNKLKTLDALIVLLRAEIAALRAQRNQPSAGPTSRNGGKSPSSGGSPSSSSGGSPSSSNGGSPSSSGGGGSASAILQTTSTQLVVTVNLDASRQSEAKVGERVTVQMPSGSIVDGRISAVSPVAQSSSNNSNGGGNGNGNNNNSSGSGSTIPVTVTLGGNNTGAGLDQAAVSVSFAQARANNVLSVPVTALLATAGGGYAVQGAAVPHRLIPVTTGLFAAGYVEVSGAGIYPGLQVTDSQG